MDSPTSDRAGSAPANRLARLIVGITAATVALLAPLPGWSVERRAVTEFRSLGADAPPTTTTRPAESADPRFGAAAMGARSAGSTTTERSGSTEAASAADTADSTPTDNPRADSTDASPATEGPTTPEIVVSDTGVDPFDLIGVRVDDALPSDSVDVRVRRDDTWSEWTNLSLTSDDGPDPGTAEAAAADHRLSTEPIWVDGADAYEVRARPALLDQADVALVREHEVAVHARIEPAQADAAPLNAPSVRSRSQWGARPATSAPSTLERISLVVIHHTATSNSYTPSQVPSILRSIQAYHMDSRGWSDIAYNLLVDRFGVAWQGRGDLNTNTIGAHAQGFNSMSAGISMIGTFETVDPPAATRWTASILAGWKLAQSRLDARSTVTVTSLGSPKYPEGEKVTLHRIAGHREIGLTSCPGAATMRYFGDITNAADWAADDYLNRPLSAALDDLEPAAGGVRAVGWAADPVSLVPVVANVDVDQQVAASAPTSQARPDVVRTNGVRSPSAGFDVFAPADEGFHSVCVRVDGAASQARLGCGRVWALTADGSPNGRIGRVGITPDGVVTVVGFALDPDTTGPIEVTVSNVFDAFAGGSPLVEATVAADGVAPLLIDAAGAYGHSHGFTAELDQLGAGSHNICVVARNVDAGADRFITCQDVTVPS